MLLQGDLLFFLTDLQVENHAHAGTQTQTHTQTDTNPTHNSKLKYIPDTHTNTHTNTYTHTHTQTSTRVLCRNSVMVSLEQATRRMGTRLEPSRGSDGGPLVEGTFNEDLGDDLKLGPLLNNVVCFLCYFFVVKCTKQRSVSYRPLFQVCSRLTNFLLIMFADKHELRACSHCV